MSRRPGAAWAAAAALLTLACSAGSGAALRAPLIDDTGQAVRLPPPPLRIVSLAPGATETLFAAGAGDQIVATVEYAVSPPAARRIPRIGDVTAVDMERLVRLHPSVVVVWPGGWNPAQIAKMAALGIPLYRQQVNSLDDLAPSVRRLGLLAGTSAVAEPAARELEDRIARVRREYANSHPPSVLLEVWNHPIYTIGGTQLLSDALAACGARNAFSDLRVLAPAINTEAVIARDPDVIVVAPPPGKGGTWLAEWRRFPTLKAVRTGALIDFPDERLIRLGPSVVEATEGLCRAIAGRPLVVPQRPSRPK
jgi:iron complex transport system substrate-binding protein